MSARLLLPLPSARRNAKLTRRCNAILTDRINTVVKKRFVYLWIDGQIELASTIRSENRQPIVRIMRREGGLGALRFVVSAPQTFVGRRRMRRVHRDHAHLAFRAQRPRRAEHVHSNSAIGFGHVIGVAHDVLSLCLCMYDLTRPLVHEVDAAKRRRIIAGRISDRKCDLERHSATWIWVAMRHHGNSDAARRTFTENG
jgi:hypothetical protein